MCKNCAACVAIDCYTSISLCPVRKDTLLSYISQDQKGYGLELANTNLAMSYV